MKNDMAEQRKEYVAISGCVGTVLSLFLSWISNHSVGLAIVHALCGWFYAIYWILKHL